LTLDENALDGNRMLRIQPLPSPTASVKLWWCDLRPSQAALEAFEPTLSNAERARMSRFGNRVLRERYVMGRGMLREILGNELHTTAASIEIVRGLRGRPRLAGETSLDFNVTHTQQIAVIAIVRDVRVGVDVERLDRQINTTGIARKFLTERERVALATLEEEQVRRRVLTLWTCKEAMSKATGDALSAPFGAISVDLKEHPTLECGPGRYSPAAWSLHFAATPAEYVTTVALWDTTSEAN
jgi:4'-phosphopantetheinyl transferase